MRGGVEKDTKPSKFLAIELSHTKVKNFACFIIISNILPMSSNCPSCLANKNSQVDSIEISRLVAGFGTAELDIDIRQLIPDGLQSIRLLECENCSLRWYSPMLAGDREFYENLQQHDWYYQVEKPEYIHASSLVSDFSSVLDVGCGQGSFSAHLKEHCSYRGLEFNNEAIRKATAGGLDVVQRTIEQEAQLRPGYYDVVCHFQVLEHISDIRPFMQACVDALKPGGLLMVTVPAEDSFLSIAPSHWLNMPPHHVTRWTDKALRHLLGSLNIVEEEVWHEPVAHFHRDWYQSVMLNLAVSNAFRRKTRLDDRSVFVRGVRRLFRLPGVGARLLARAERNFAYRTRGLSVCCSGTKAVV
jgi:2-polyprenyl-3-methyl-5-hydroxy-6-metoxy-1,4-benzoquinol methylase